MSTSLWIKALFCTKEIGADLEHGESLLSSPLPKLPSVVSGLNETNAAGGNGVKESWASVVAQKVGGMKLSFIKPPLMEGKVKIKPPPSVVQKGVKRCENTVVGFFLDKLPFSFVQNHAMKLWGSKGLLEVLSNGNGFYFFRFLDNNSTKFVLDGGPWHFGGRPIFLQLWKMGMNLFRSGCKKVPIWAHFYNIPVEYWTEEGLSHIASVVRHPLYVDQMTESVKRINFAWIYIEIEVDDVLPECFDIELLDGFCVKIRVEYNWVPKRCMVCKEFGHLAKNCRKVKGFEWRPKDAPRPPSRPRSPAKTGLDDHVHKSPVGAGHGKEDDGKEVKRSGKTIMVDVSPLMDP